MPNNCGSLCNARLSVGNKTYTGQKFGHWHNAIVCGEIVFQTGMTGYVEAMTDPSYKGQILVFTYPMIGNYGITKEMMESKRIQVSGVIVRTYDYCHGFNEWLCQYGIPGICDIDTRDLTLFLRDQGTMNGTMHTEELGADVNVNDINTPSMVKGRAKSDEMNLWKQVTDDKVNMENIVSKTSVQKPVVMVIDCGMKNSQLVYLHKYFQTVIVPCHHDVYKSYLELAKVDGIFISNGPGDPSELVDLHSQVKKLIDEGLPIFGICFGHQIIAHAVGGTTSKMKYGNRSQNVPVRLLNSQRGYITTQNHGYQVDINSLPEGWLPIFTNLNDGSNEGIYSVNKDKPCFSVQFHPEGNAGPLDTDYLFNVFYELISHKHEGICALDAFKLGLNWDDIVVSKRTRKRVLVLGSGGLTIGQAGEFDYSGSQALKSYKEEGLYTILVNPNIATVQTTLGIDLADKVYSVPVTPEYVKQIIDTEEPDCIAVSFGGQTALNCAVSLYRDGVIGGTTDVEILGTNIEMVIRSEDREAFRSHINTIYVEGKQLDTAPSACTSCYTEAARFASDVGYPILVRNGFALGGLGSGFAENEMELSELFQDNCIVDKSLKGWREVEYEIVRDGYGNCITVCNMENLDPVGVHTGESIVVAPSQTLNNREYFLLRSVALAVAAAFNIVGECNIQYALHPETEEFYIIEINARLSRSSALASKATGYPLAFIAAKLSLGYSLLELKNCITRDTSALYEPSLDYCVVKLPRWELDKFDHVDRKIGTAMKSVGEVMAIGTTFEEALMKGIRMVGGGLSDLLSKYLADDTIKVHIDEVNRPAVDRVVKLMGYLRNGGPLEPIQLHSWFVKRIKNIVVSTEIRQNLTTDKSLGIVSDPHVLMRFKQNGYSDKQIATVFKTTPRKVYELRVQHSIRPFLKRIDTVAGEFPCDTNYLYSTYNAAVSDDINIHKSVLIIGSGVYRIGSSVEFDWCSVSTVRTCKQLGYHTMMLNYNPETVSTDYDTVDCLLFEEITAEVVLDLWSTGNIYGVIVSVGGQESNNIVNALEAEGVRILGTDPKMIDIAENRFKFSRMLSNIGVDQPEWKELIDIDDAAKFCDKVSYPCLVRPSYVLSGAGMNVAFNNEELRSYLGGARKVSGDYPVVISKFIIDAKEIEVDAVAQGGELIAVAVSEHIENAGVHSGDASLICPPQDLTQATLDKINGAVAKIAKALNINGPFNIQFIAKNDSIKVIECNLRASRSFPFVSKIHRINMIELATHVMLNVYNEGPVQIWKEHKVGDLIGVKVPQFSFKRLPGADCVLGVEMKSTGEVACFDSNHKVAYIKALLSTGYTLPRPGDKILLAVGSLHYKLELAEHIKRLSNNYQLYATSGTADYYNHTIPGTNITSVPWASLDRMLDETDFKFIINISMLNRSRVKSYGYKLRMIAIKKDIPLLTDVKGAKMFIDGCMLYSQNPTLFNLTAYDAREIKPINTTYKNSGDKSFLTGRCIITVDDLNRTDLRCLFEQASLYMSGVDFNKSLENKVIAMLFYEPSTRTSCSFEAAVKRLGGEVLNVNINNSSLNKGESYKDTIRCIEQYADAIILRGKRNSASDAAKYSSVPIINAGDGSGEHPTQALLDLFTIREERGSITGLNITMVGDLRYSRTVHSLAKLLCRYDVRKINYVTTEFLQISDSIYEYVDKHGITQEKHEYEQLNEVVKNTDVLYVTRLQKERYGEHNRSKISEFEDVYRITPSTLAYARSDMLVMHPLPRNKELSEELDTDPRSVYFKQMKYGMYLRMALLNSICISK